MAPRHLLALLSATWTASAAVSPANQQACRDIKIALPGKVWFPDEAEYIKENKDYYNIGLAELAPACITFSYIFARRIRDNKDSKYRNP